MYLFKKIQYVLCKSWNKYIRNKYFVRPCEGRIFLGANFPWANFPRANFLGVNFPRANFPVSLNKYPRSGASTIDDFGRLSVRGDISDFNRLIGLF